MYNIRHDLLRRKVPLSLKLIRMFSSDSSALSALQDLTFLKINFLHLLLDANVAIIKISPPTKMIPIWDAMDNDVVVGVAVGVVAVVVVAIAIVVVVIIAFVVSIMT